MMKGPFPLLFYHLPSQQWKLPTSLSRFDLLVFSRKQILIQFIRQNQDIIREKINSDDFVDGILEDWFTTHLRQIHEWLKARSGNSLHIHQLKSCIRIFQRMYKDFELQVTTTVYKNVD